MTDEVAIFIGGDYDGETWAIDEPRPTLSRLQPTEVDWRASLQADPVTFGPAFNRLDYYLALDDLGYPSRDDLGRLRYLLQKA